MDQFVLSRSKLSMPPISVLIKPASGNCNMRCNYCFYTDEIKNREVKSYGMMSLEDLENIVKKILEYADHECTIAFQGGEPTLAGLSFYEKLMEYQKRYNKKGIRINNAIQTNGYLIDSHWAEFFSKNHFLVGLSLDGVKEIHDRERFDAAGKGTYKQVMRAVQLFQRYEVEFNILTVITAHTANSINKIYGFFKRNNLTYHQYIPCLDPLMEERGGQKYSLTPEKYLKFLKDLFDLWYQDADKGNFVYNRYFENLLMLMTGRHPESCGISGHCSRQYVIEADGSVFPCDFYVMDSYRLGSLVTNSFEELENMRENLKFISNSFETHEDCKKCKWYAMCRGGCRRDREPMVNGKLSKNYFCYTFSEFFEYAHERLQKLIIKYQLNA